MKFSSCCLFLIYIFSWTTNIYTILADHHIQHFPFCQSAHIENWNFDVSHAIRHAVYKFHLLSLVFCRRTAVVILCRSVVFQFFHLLQHEKNILDGIKFGPVPIFGRRKRLEYTRADIFNSVWIVFSYNVRTLNAGPSVGANIRDVLRPTTPTSWGAPDVITSLNFWASLFRSNTCIALDCIYKNLYEIIDTRKSSFDGYCNLLLLLVFSFYDLLVGRYSKNIWVKLLIVFPPSLLFQFRMEK